MDNPNLDLKCGEQILKCKYCDTVCLISKRLYEEIKRVMPDFEYVCHDCRFFHFVITHSHES